MTHVQPAPTIREGSGSGPGHLFEYMRDSRDLVLAEMGAFIPKDGAAGAVLYDLVFEYPLRAAKALRPALCIATCRALGGSLEGVVRSAAALELYHNSFLIHDDIEDGSEQRRAAPTLHRIYGTPVAINVGDAMLALALRPLLDNMRILGLGRALRILQAVEEMARETVEGQAMELDWIRKQSWDLVDRSYLRMVHKKTSCYTFIAPMTIGAMAAGATDAVLRQLRWIGALIGIAFQIQDDALNLDGDEAVYGKERFGDLWEGKHTLIVMHALRCASDRERRRALEILARARPESGGDPWTMDLKREISELANQGQLTVAGRKRLESVLDHEGRRSHKTAADVRYLYELIQTYHSVDYARAVAARHALRAQRSLAHFAAPLPDSPHLRFLRALLEFTLERNY